MDLENEEKKKMSEIYEKMKVLSKSDHITIIEKEFIEILLKNPFSENQLINHFFFQFGVKLFSIFIKIKKLKLI